MRFRSGRVFFGVVLCLGAFSLSVLGVAKTAKSSVKSSCKEDIEKFCKGVHSSEGRVHACLKSHEKELSSDCQARMTHWRSTWVGCEVEVELYCQKAKGGHRGVDQCLKDHQADLSDKCRKAHDVK